MPASFSMPIQVVQALLNPSDVSYPHALHHLELLQHAQFRAMLKKDEYMREYLNQKQFDHWRTW